MRNNYAVQVVKGTTVVGTSEYDSPEAAAWELLKWRSVYTAMDKPTITSTPSDVTVMEAYCNRAERVLILLVEYKA